LNFLLLYFLRHIPINKCSFYKVGFSGLSGKHRFWSDHQVESVVTLESFCMLNAKPGPQSQAFPDAEVSDELTSSLSLLAYLLLQ
jgi:hypothetical protein